MSFAETQFPNNSSRFIWVSRGTLPDFLGIDDIELIHPGANEEWWDRSLAHHIPVLIDGTTVAADELTVCQAKQGNTKPPVVAWLAHNSDLDRWCEAGVDDVIFDDASDFEIRNRMRLACSRMRRNHSALHGEISKDSLTGLPNRSVLESEQVRRHLCGPDSSGVVAFIDLNGFKGVNDTFGHASGDQVLVEMANRFRKTLRGKDLIIRWGGDEFLIILPGAAKPQAVQAFLNRVKAIAEIPIQLNGRDVSLSASFGSARWGGETTFHTAIDIADDAMYNAKRKSIGTEHGIECVAVHKHFSHSSLESGRIRVVMQPVFDIDCSRIQSYEALMRFHDSNGHLHSACDVLTAAAQTGMLDKMEVSVWHQACQAAGELKTLTLSAPTIAINVFPTTVMRRGFLSELRTICKCHGIVHEQVIAEIAEDRLIAGWSTCFPFLEELVEHGFGVGLDDCVMELPLTRLTSLPFRHIKVRADILRRASLRDASAYRLLRALESIRSTFPLDVIVSRVESDDDIRLAKLFNFTQVQGFYFRSTDFSPSCGDASTPSRSSSTAFPAPRPLDLAPL